MKSIISPKREREKKTSNIGNGSHRSLFSNLKQKANCNYQEPNYNRKYPIDNMLVTVLQLIEDVKKESIAT